MINREVLVDGDPEAQPRVLFCRSARLTQWAVDDLAAPFWRCYVPLDPGGCVRWRGRLHRLRPGESLLIAPGTAYAASLEQPFRKAYLHFAWNGSAPPGLTTVAVPSARLRILRSASERADGMGLLLALLAQVADGLDQGRRATPTESRRSDLVSAILDVLQARLQDPPDNAELGRRFHLHPNSLVRRFSAEMGVPPQRHLRDLRLDAVAEALAAGERSIDDLAADFAFVDRHHLTRAFTQRWGCPPAEFRRRNRGAATG